MAQHAVTLAVLISRKRAELDVIMIQHSELATEAKRGTFSARNKREQLHREWDLGYDEWCILRIRQALDAVS